MNLLTKQFLNAFENHNPIFEEITPEENNFIVEAFERVDIKLNLMDPEAYVDLVATRATHKRLKATQRLWMPTFQQVFGDKLICFVNERKKISKSEGA